MTPAGLIVFRFATGRLGANPIEAALNDLGLWALIVLLASLALTPIEILTGWKHPLRYRRLLGLCAFAYAVLHFSTYVVLDQGLSWADIWGDIVRRKFMTVGFAAFVLLVPLAVTSTNKMVKRLGFPRWKRLHRLVYLAAVLAVVHFIWRVKSDLREPLIYGGVLGTLLVIRVLAFLRKGRVTSRSAPA
jgi:sulfoxide reductase heme-binding subunit YedZ